jgi:hypothetical protein
LWKALALNPLPVLLCAAGGCFFAAWPSISVFSGAYTAAQAHPNGMSAAACAVK